VPIAAFDIARYKGDVAPDERFEREFETPAVASLTKNGKT
jgi:hypothetical protein